MRNRRFTAILLSISLIFTLNISVLASVSVPKTTDRGITAKIESTASCLSSLVPDEDYVDGEGVFLADSKDKALDVTASYGGTLKSFHDGVAVIEFAGSTVDAYEDASISSVTEYVQPNYIYHLFDTEEPANGSDDADAGIYSEDAPNDKYADSSDPYYQYFHDKVHTLEAHKTTTGKGAKIAVIDTGCIPDQEDSRFDNSHCLCVSSLADTNGIDYINGHGIHCTGIIHEAKDNSLGGYGIAPDAEIYSIRAINDSGRLTSAETVEAIQMAIDLKVNVISMSFGGFNGYWREAEEEMIDKAYAAGITCVAAAGNSHTNEQTFPAAFDHVIAVAASDKDDNLADYSNYGDWVDIVAPGSGITAAYCYKPYRPEFITGTASQNSYGRLDGTSMACPVVAGIAALCYAASPDLLNRETFENKSDIVKEILLENTDKKTYSCQNSYGERSVTGLVQADKAVSAAEDIYLRNTTYSLVDEAGIHGGRLKEKIARGKTVKLTIGDIFGEYKDKDLKKAAKRATWTSSDPSILKVKNGKVTCAKNAPLGAKVNITVNLDDDEMQCVFTVTEPIIASGYITAQTGNNGKVKIKNRKDKIYYYASKGGFNLLCPSQNGIPDLYLAFSKDASRYQDGTWACPMDDSYNYKIEIPKKNLNNMDVKYDKMGRMVSANFYGEGKYTIKITPIDGSKKSFKCKLNVRY